MFTIPVSKQNVIYNFYQTEEEKLLETNNELNDFYRCDTEDFSLRQLHTRNLTAYKSRSQKRPRAIPLADLEGGAWPCPQDANTRVIYVFGQL